MPATQPAAVGIAAMTRAQRAALPLSADVAQALAEQHGVCIRPLAMRRIDTTTGPRRGRSGAVWVHPGRTVPPVCGEGPEAADGAVP
ncbi:MAG: hypothetical protein ACRD0H_27705 [Actinomycetes bacterium]